MIETRDKYINGHCYTITQLPARKALRLKTRLLKIFGPSLAQMFLSAAGEEGNITKAIELLANNLDENVLETLVVEMLAGVRKNGVELTAPVIDLEFAGDMQGLYKVVGAVVEVNYSNFLSMIGITSLYEQETAVKDESRKAFTRK